MNLVKRNTSPFDIDSLFDDAFPSLPSFRLMPDMMSDSLPPVDISESDKRFVLKADFPGMKKEDINVSVVNNTLTLSAEHKEEQEQKKEGRVVRRERRYGRYSRSFTLGQDIDEDKIEATYDNGVLTLVLPKAEKKESRGKAIRIK